MSPPLMGQVGERTAVALTGDIPEKIEERRGMRDELRKLVTARGGDPETIQEIFGDCPAQTATQIRNYRDWLSSH